MTVRGLTVALLDRPGGRGLLAALTNLYAQRGVGADVEVRFDEVWAHRAGRIWFPDLARYTYYAADIPWWVRQPDQWKRETHDYWCHVYTPKPGDTIVDVGAGKGEDVLTFAEAVGPTGRVLAVEAHPASFRTLQHLQRLNRLSQVTCLNAAAVDRTATVHIGSGDDWQSNSVLTAAADSAATPIQGRPLDDLCESMGSIDFLKMNIEGAERLAVAGMSGVVGRVGTICIACHDFRANRGHGEHFRSRTQVIEFLRDSGFALRLRDDDSRDWVRDHIHGVRPAHPDHSE